MLHGLLSDLETWKTNLPDSLKYRGPETPRNAGESYILVSHSYFLSGDWMQVFCICFTHVSA